MAKMIKTCVLRASGRPAHFENQPPISFRKRAIQPSKKEASQTRRMEIHPQPKAHLPTSSKASKKYLKKSGQKNGKKNMLQSTPELPVPRDPGLDLLYDVLTAGGSDALHLGRGVHPAGGTRALHSQAGNEGGQQGDAAHHVYV